jgi:hypothetical protein
MSVIEAHSTQLLIMIPTRSRPKQLFEMLDKYYAHLSGNVDVLFVISCDTDDATMNNKQVIERLQTYPHLVCNFAPNKSKIEAFNRDLQLYDFDMVLGTADDTEPCVHGFDQLIVDAMYRNFPDLDGVLNPYDGHVAEECNTLPVIGRKFFDRFGYFYHPDYKALVCDMEITNVTRMLKKEFVIEQPLIIHNHPAWTFAEEDELYKHNEQYHNADVATFYRRRAIHYDMSQQEFEAVATKLWSILLVCKDQSELRTMENLKARLQQQIDALGLRDEIEILQMLSNEHVSHIRNKLLNASSGKYVQFIESSDVVHDTFIKYVYNQLLDDVDCVRLSINEISLFNPIKRWIAIQFPFYAITRAEEDWMRKVATSNIVQTKKTVMQPSVTANELVKLIFV